MATGVGYVVKALRPDVEIVCVQPAGAPAMTRSWHRRRVVTTASADTIADGVAGRFPLAAVLDDLLVVADDAVPVAEASIVAAMRMLQGVRPVPVGSRAAGRSRRSCSRCRS